MAKPKPFYIIISASSTEKLENLVNVAISEGYMPLGGVAIAEDSGINAFEKYCQAMTKPKL